eukprot:TRINITY_DN3254_c0_g3_i1.p1 TRINITY_DN3254_c0_g3~~TRINITY_DN3254_c0_g3_i1.p1  ORF type:complete len:274 (-),score=63.49 TRINITY_DN3254_c0_g3_i1:244-1065(-)
MAVPSWAESEEKMRQQFQDADANGDGVMDLHELTAVLRRLGDFSDAEVQHMFDAMDADGNGTVDLDEFFNWVRGPGHSKPFQIQAEDEILAAAELDEKENEAIADEILATVERPESQDDLQGDSETTQMASVSPVMEPEAKQSGKETAQDNSMDAKMTQVISEAEPEAEQNGGGIPGTVPEVRQSGGEAGQDESMDAKVLMAVTVSDANHRGAESLRQKSTDVKMTSVVPVEAAAIHAESARNENISFKHLPMFVVCLVIAVLAVILFSALHP